jgi:protein-disulfide isomerase
VLDPRAVTLRSLIVCLSLLALACNRGSDPTPSTKPAPSAVTSSGAAGDCDAYKRAFCAKTEPDSADCKAIEEIASLLPPAACAAGLANLDYTASRLGDKRKSCNELVGRLCKDLGEQSASCQMVRQRTPDFPADRCAMMIKQYQEVLSELRAQEEKNKPLDQAGQQRLLAGAKASFGAKSAKVQLVEFSDFECPFCARAASAVGEVKKKYGDKVLFVFRQFPLEFHADAELAAEASLAAQAQGKFWEFHDKLFQNQRELKREHLEKYAAELGLDMAKFKKALDDGSYKSAIEQDLSLGKSVNVEGTPTLFLNGRRVEQTSDASALFQAIDAALANWSGASVAAGESAATTESAAAAESAGTTRTTGPSTAGAHAAVSADSAGCAGPADTRACRETTGSSSAAVASAADDAPARRSRVFRAARAGGCE